MSFYLLADIGSYAVWIILGFIIAALLFRFVYRSTVYPDRELPLEELPTPVKHMIQSMVPNWEISQIRVSYRAKDEPRNFFIQGEREGFPGEIEIETRSKTVQIREAVIRYDLNPGSRTWVQESSLSEVALPEKVRQKLTARLDQFGTPLTSLKCVGKGQLGGQEGYQITGLAGKWKFAARLLGSGKIREIELEHG